MAEKNSLWKNIRNKAEQNRRTGATPKKPTAEMLRQERKIKAQKADGGYMYDGGGKIYANKQGVIMGPVQNPDGSYTVPVSNEGLPQVNLPEYELKLEENPYGPITEEEYLNSSFNPINWVLPSVEPEKPRFRPDGTLIPASGKIDPHYIEGEFIGVKKGKQAVDKFVDLKDLDYKDIETFKNSSVKNILNDSKNKILKTVKDIKSTADEFIVTPIQFRKEIKELKKLKADYPKIFNTEEGKKRLGLLGIDPNKISDYDLTFKPNMSSMYVTGNNDLINKINIDFREIQRSKKEGDMISPKSVFEHELGHLLQKESHKQEGILSDLKQYDLDLKKYDDEMLDYNNQVERINNNPFLNEMDKRFKIASTRKPIEPQKPVIRPKKTLIDKGAEHLTRNDDIINDELIAASNIEGTNILTFPEKSYSYFNTELEKFPHLREMRENMIESGIIKNIYDPITNEDVLKFVTNNSGDRVASFINRSPNNIELLRNLLNHMPAAIPAIGIGAKVLQQNSEPQHQAYGGPINPYMYYAGGPMYYGDGGKIWKHIGAGAYGILEGGLDTLTFGATDQLTDKGFDWLTKVGNKNLDLNDPKNAKFLRTQQQIRGYSNVAGAIGTAAFTGQWGSAIGQSAKGVNTAFQATEGLSDDFKKWSNISSQAIGIGAGLAGGNLNSAQSASKIGQAATKFGSQASKVAPYANQAMGMLGNSGQPLWQQAEARQEYLNSPEYLAMREQQNQAYVNQGLSFAANGGPVNNNLVTLQTDSMRNRYKTYKTKYRQGGSMNQSNVDFISDEAGLHQENFYDGVPLTRGKGAYANGGAALVEAGEGVIRDEQGNPSFILPDQGDGEPVYMLKPNASYTNFETDKYGNYIPLNITVADWRKQQDKGSKFRDQENNVLSNPRKDKDNQLAMRATEIQKQLKAEQAQQNQMMVEGALQYAAAGGKLNKDLERILSDDIQSYVEADNYYAYGGYLPKDKGFNMPNSYAKGGSIHIKKSKRGTFTAAAKKRGKSVQEFAKDVLRNKGNYSAAMVKKANFARNAASWKHAVGGPLYGNTDSEYTYAHGGPVVSNVNQGFGLYAQNRGGMMMADGGMMMPQDDGMSKQIAAALQQGADPQKLLQQLIESGMDPQQAQLILEAIMGKMQASQPQAPMMAMGGTMYAPGGPRKFDFQHMKKMLLNKTYRDTYNLAKDFNSIKPGNYPNLFTPIEGEKTGPTGNSGEWAGFYPATEDEAKQYQGYDPTKVNQSASTSGLGTGSENIFGDDKLGKALAIGQAAIPLGEAAYHMFNKPKHLKAPVVQPATVDYSASRTIDQRQTDMAENAYLNRLRGSASTSGMFANNAKEYLLRSNADQAGRNAISVQDQMNKNAEEIARANALNAQSKFNTDQLNYDIDQARIGNIFGALNNAGTLGFQSYGDISNRRLQEKQIASTQSANVTPITINGRVYPATKGPDGYYFNGQRIAEFGT